MRRSVRSIALLLVCLESKPNSYYYSNQLPSIPKLQHYRDKALAEADRSEKTSPETTAPRLRL